MASFPAALSHGSIKEIFPNIFFVTGTMETILQEMEWQFSRNMTIVRDNERLIIINSIRLSEEGLAELDNLGKVTDVICLGALHGRDDAFYLERYKANYWTMAGNPHHSASHHQTLSAGKPLPISNATLFEFQTSQLAEGIIHLNREEGIVIACDALQNWLEADEYFSQSSKELMQSMGFFTPANIGPVWLQAATPSAEDFKRLKTLSFKHALCGHGEPLLETAQQDYHATFNRIFGI